MNAKDIKSHIWITYQGADNSVWCYAYRKDKPQFNRMYNSKLNFPILNTTEIGKEIQGEDLELVKEFVGIDELTGGDKYIVSLRYTPKQTPKADSEKKLEKHQYLDLVKMGHVYTSFNEDDNFSINTPSGSLTFKETEAVELANRIMNHYYTDYPDTDKLISPPLYKVDNQSDGNELLDVYNLAKNFAMDKCGSPDHDLFGAHYNSYIEGYNASLHPLKGKNKVDNHIGVQTLFEKCDDAIYSLRQNAAGDNILQAYNDALNDAIKAIEPVIATYRTQHPNPAMVDRIKAKIGEIDVFRSHQRTSPAKRQYSYAIKVLEDILRNIQGK